MKYVPTKIIKLCSSSLTPLLTNLFNAAILQSKNPNEWKFAWKKRILGQSMTRIIEIFSITFISLIWLLRGETCHIRLANFLLMLHYMTKKNKIPQLTLHDCKWCPQLQLSR